jgi:hypothetical protein
VVASIPEVEPIYHVDVEQFSISRGILGRKHCICLIASLVGLIVNAPAAGVDAGQYGVKAVLHVERGENGEALLSGLQAVKSETDAASGLLAFVGVGRAAAPDLTPSRVPGHVVVTTWADAGITPDVNPGRWVQLGEATWTNFWKTGLPGPKAYSSSQFPFFKLVPSKVPFTNSLTVQLPASSLQWPPGAEFLKGLLGQRVIKEP